MTLWLLPLSSGWVLALSLWLIEVMKTPRSISDFLNALHMEGLRPWWACPGRSRQGITWAWSIWKTFWPKGRWWDELESKSRVRIKWPQGLKVSSKQGAPYHFLLAEDYWRRLSFSEDYVEAWDEHMNLGKAGSNHFAEDEVWGWAAGLDMAEQGRPLQVMMYVWTGTYWYVSNTLYIKSCCNA